MKKTLLTLCGTCIALSACSSVMPKYQPTDPKEVAFIQLKQEQRAYNAKLDRILLINPTTREVLSCNSNRLTQTGIVSEAVELCAVNMEKEGFIRVTDIPRFTAPDDQHSYANYPSGRFRGVDPTPRW